MLKTFVKVIAGLMLLLVIAPVAIIAVPTGIVTVELADARRRAMTTQVCPECAAEDHDQDAKYCKHCGAQL